MAPAVPLHATPAQLQAQGVADPFQAMYDPWRQGQPQTAPWEQYQRVTYPTTVENPSVAAQGPPGMPQVPTQSAPTTISIEPAKAPPPVHFPSNTGPSVQSSPFQMSPEFMAQFMMMNQMMQMRPPMPMPHTVSGQIMQEHANKQEPSVPSASAQIPQQQFQTLVGPSPQVLGQLQWDRWYTQDRGSKDPIPKWDGKNAGKNLKNWLKALRIWRQVTSEPIHKHGYILKQSFERNTWLFTCSERVPEH